MGRITKATPRPLYRRERDPLLILQEFCSEEGPVWTSGENLTRFDPRAVQSITSRYTDYGLANFCFVRRKLTVSQNHYYNAGQHSSIIAIYALGFRYRVVFQK
jgi:hypothetical protein